MTPSDATDATKSSRKVTAPWFKRKTFIFLVVSIGTVLLLFALLPIGTKLYLQKWLLDNGADVATIKELDINLFTGVAALYGVDVQKNGRTVMSNSEILVNIGLKNLFDKEARLEQATLADVLLEVEQTEDFIRIGSYAISPSQKESSPIQEPDQIPEEHLRWILRADKIDLRNVHLMYTSPDLHVDMVIEEALIDRFDTSPDGRGGEVTLKGTLNGSPIVLDLEKLRLIPTFELTGHVNIAQFKLDDLAQILDDIFSNLSGVAGVNGTIDMVVAGSDIRANYDGNISLGYADLGGDGWKTEGGATWNGEASVERGSEETTYILDGALQARSFGFNMIEPSVEIESDKMELTGKTTTRIASGISIESDTVLNIGSTDFAMDDLRAGTDAAGWDGTLVLQTDADTGQLTLQTDGTLNAVEPHYAMGSDENKMTIENHQLQWQGDIGFFTGQENEPSDRIEVIGSLTGEQTMFRYAEQTEIEQDRLTVSGQSKVILDHGVQASYDGDISLEGTRVDVASVDFSDRLFTWSGNLGYQYLEDQQEFSVDGLLKAHELTAALKTVPYRLSQEGIDSRINLTAIVDRSSTVTGTVDASATTLHVQDGDDSMLKVASISIDKFKGYGPDGVSVEMVNVQDVEFPTSEIIPVAGTISSVQATEITSQSLTDVDIGSLVINNSRVVDGASQTTLADVQKIEVDSIAIPVSREASADALRLIQGTFYQKQQDDPLAILKQVDVDGIVYSGDEGLNIERINFDSLVAAMLKSDSTKSAEADADEKKRSPEVHSEERSNSEERRPPNVPVKIKEVLLSGQSSLEFTDQSLSKPFTTQFVIDSLKITDIDLSDSQQPLHYSLSGSFDKHAPLIVSGSARPLASDIAIDQQLSLKNYPLPKLSPYTIKSLGTYFTSGLLDLTSDLQLAEGTITMENNLILKDVDSETADKDLSAEIDHKLPVSLDLALSMLKDSNGLIDLDIPISGPLADIDVGIADLLITPLSKGISLAVAPYLAYTFLGPTGALIYAGTKIGEALIHTDLPVLLFEPGQAEITDVHREQLKNVSYDILENWEQSYSICPKMAVTEVSSSRAEQSEKHPLHLSDEERKILYDLGESRAAAVKDFLQSQYMIPDDQLLICNPVIDFNEAAEPRIEFML